MATSPVSMRNTWRDRRDDIPKTPGTGRAIIHSPGDHRLPCLVQPRQLKADEVVTLLLLLQDYPFPRENTATLEGTSPKWNHLSKGYTDPVKKMQGPAMRAAAGLAIDRELRDEPLEEFTLQEVNELAEGIRERVYTSLRHHQQEEARRIQEGKERKRTAQLNHDRKHTERTRKKVLFPDETRRRAVTLVKTHALSFYATTPSSGGHPRTA